MKHMTFDSMIKGSAALLISTLISTPVLAANNSLDAADGDPANAVWVDNDGKMGVGTTAPSRDMEVKGDLLLSNRNHGGFFLMTSSNGSMEIASGNDDNSYIDFKGKSNLDADYMGRILYNDARASFAILGGKVGIGTANPQSTLAVNGKLTAKEIEVTNTGWADYVFKADYPLPKLETVEAHIKQFGRLPNMPNAQEIEEKGLNLGESQVKLLEKVEELTLYMIELNNEVKQQREEIARLKKELAQQ